MAYKYERQAFLALLSGVVYSAAVRIIYTTLLREVRQDLPRPLIIVKAHPERNCSTTAVVTHGCRL